MNKLKLNIESLIHDDFGGSSYQKYSLTEMQDKSVEKLNEALLTLKGKPEYVTCSKLITKIKKSTDKIQLLTLLSEYLLSTEGMSV